MALVTLATVAALVIQVSLADLVILVTMITLFWSSNQFYRPEYITVLEFFDHPPCGMMTGMPE